MSSKSPVWGEKKLAKFRTQYLPKGKGLSIEGSDELTRQTKRISLRKKKDNHAQPHGC